MAKYTIKEQIITEKPSLIVEAETDEELIIKYKQELEENQDLKDTTKKSFLITKLEEQEVTIKEIKV